MLEKLNALFDWLFPPLRIRLKEQRRKKLLNEDSDDWATDWLDKQEQERRTKRAKRKN